MRRFDKNSPTFYAPTQCSKPMKMSVRDQFPQAKKIRYTMPEIKPTSAFKPLPDWKTKQLQRQAEIEAEAAKHPNYTFYFVGKIEHTSWRHRIFDLRNIDYPWDTYIYGYFPVIDHCSRRLDPPSL
jgi:hypothetical protein